MLQVYITVVLAACLSVYLSVANLTSVESAKSIMWRLENELWLQSNRYFVYFQSELLTHLLRFFLYQNNYMPSTADQMCGFPCNFKIMLIYILIFATAESIL